MLAGAALLLTMFGVLMVFDASVVEAYRDFLDKFYFARQQLVWAVAGVAAMLIFSSIPYQVYRKAAIWAFAVSLLLLVLVLIPSVGTKVLGARRWITIGGIGIQPAELVKLTITMYLSTFFEKNIRFIHFALIVSIVVGLIMLEPDLGTAAVVAVIAFAIYFLAGASWKSIFLTSAAGILGATGFILSSQYRRARILTFLDPTKDPLGASYHIRQVLIALGSGGLFGVGIGKSRQKYEYIPAATTDSIFAIIAEELGFLGGLTLITLFVVFFVRSFSIAKRAADRFGQLLASGIAIWIATQTVINLGTMVALVPLTGVPLPFISYGGSSTIAVLSAVGILLNISKSADEKQ